MAEAFLRRLVIFMIGLSKFDRCLDHEFSAKFFSRRQGLKVPPLLHGDIGAPVWRRAFASTGSDANTGMQFSAPSFCLK
jgi:hypothetical protein